MRIVVAYDPQVSFSTLPSYLGSLNFLIFFSLFNDFQYLFNDFVVVSLSLILWEDSSFLSFLFAVSIVIYLTLMVERKNIALMKFKLPTEYHPTKKYILLSCSFYHPNFLPNLHKKNSCKVILLLLKENYITSLWSEFQHVIFQMIFHNL